MSADGIGCGEVDLVCRWTVMLDCSCKGGGGEVLAWRGRWHGGGAGMKLICSDRGRGQLRRPQSTFELSV